MKNLKKMLVIILSLIQIMPYTAYASDDIFLIEDNTAEYENDLFEAETTEEQYVDDEASDLYIEDEDVVSKYEDSSVEESVALEYEYSSEEILSDVPASGKCGENATYTIINNGWDIDITIDGSGDMFDYEVGETPWAFVGHIVELKIGNGITSIGNNTFCNKNIDNIDFPNTLVKIGEGSFSGVIYGSREISIPDSVKTIGKEAFLGFRYKEWENEKDITSTRVKIHFGNGIERIEEGAFRDCKFMLDTMEPDSKFVLPDSISYIGEMAFLSCGIAGNIILPEGLKYIGANALANNKFFNTELVIPKSVSDETSNDAIANILEDNFNNLEKITNKSKVCLLLPEKEDCFWCDFDGNIITSITNGTAYFGGIKNTGEGFAGEEKYIKTIPSAGGKKKVGYVLVINNSDIPYVPEDEDKIGKQYGHNNIQGDFFEIVIGDGVSQIWDNAFRGCEKITSFTFGNNVKRVCSRALDFKNGGFSKVVISIPQSVEYIGNYAFYHCTFDNLSTLPNSVKEIGYGAFDGCRGLASDFIIPEGVKKVSADAFINCADIKSITFPSTLEEADGMLSWWENKQLEKIVNNSKIAIKIGEPSDNIAWDGVNENNELPAGKTAVKKVKQPEITGKMGTLTYQLISNESENGYVLKVAGTGAMKDLQPHKYPWAKYIDNITELEVGDGVTYIGKEAFCRMPILKSVKIAGSVKEIGVGAFEECNRLCSLELSEGIEVIRNRAFHGCLGLTSLSLPDTVMRIGDDNENEWWGAFGECTSLKDIKWPNSLRVIGKRSFCECKSLEGELKLPDSVLIIGEEAFSGCEKLTGRLIIPNNAKRVEGRAFEKCYRITSIVFPAAADISGSIWNNTGVTTVVIPKDTMSKWGWNATGDDFKDVNEIISLQDNFDIRMKNVMYVNGEEVQYEPFWKDRASGTLFSTMRKGVAVREGYTKDAGTHIYYLNTNEELLKVGESVEISLMDEILPANASWSATDESVVSLSTVSANTITVTGKKDGVSNVIARAEDGSEYSCIVKVGLGTTINRLSDTEYELHLATKEKFLVDELKKTQEDGKQYSISYAKTDGKKSDSQYASMNNQGLITAKKEGISFISVIKGNRKYKITVIVDNPSFDYQRDTTNTNEKFTFKFKSCGLEPTFSLDNNAIKKGIAEINSETGEVTALKKGTVVVTVTIGGWQNIKYARKLTKKLKIFDPTFVDVKIGKNDINNIPINKLVQLKVKNGYGNTICKVISGNGIIEVDGKTPSKIKSVGYGTVTLEITNNGRIMHREITVPEPEIIAKDSVKVGKTMTLKVQNGLKYSNWSVSDESIANISNKGVLKALKPGTVTITLQNDGDIKVLDENGLWKEDKNVYAEITKVICITSTE